MPVSGISSAWPSPALFAEAATWSSLEVAKLAVSTLTPVVVLALGVWVQRLLRGAEFARWLGQRQLEWRMKVYEDVAPKLNTLYCYLTFRGDFKELDPPAVLALKRDLDRRAAIYRPLLGPGFAAAYARFMECCFQTYTGKNRDARIRAGFSTRKPAWGQGWQAEWEQLFVADAAEKSELGAVEDAYEEVMDALAAGLSAVPTPETGGPGPGVQGGGREGD